MKFKFVLKCTTRTIIYNINTYQYFQCLVWIILFGNEMLKSCNLTILKHITLELGLISERWNSFNVGAVLEGGGTRCKSILEYIITKDFVSTRNYSCLRKVIEINWFVFKRNIFLQNLKRNHHLFLKNSLRRLSVKKGRERSPCFLGHLFWPLEGLWTFKKLVKQLIRFSLVTGPQIINLPKE